MARERASGEAIHGQRRGTSQTTQRPAILLVDVRCNGRGGIRRLRADVLPRRIQRRSQAHDHADRPHPWRAGDHLDPAVDRANATGRLRPARYSPAARLCGRGNRCRHHRSRNLGGDPQRAARSHCGDRGHARRSVRLLGLPLRQHPGPDLRLEHLADFGAWKFIPDFNLLGRFDASQPLLHKRR